MNNDTKPIANSIPTVNLRLPRHMVVIQLNTFTADGTAINNVKSTNIEPRNGLIPVTNIWCAQTRNANTAIPMSDMIIAKYPKIGLRLLQDNISDAIPIPGSIMIYTSG